MHAHIAFAFTATRTAITLRNVAGEELASEVYPVQGSAACAYWQAVLRALNMAVTWRAERVFLYSHQGDGPAGCDLWRAACKVLADRVPGGVTVEQIPAERNAAARLIE
ncbi:MAG: hypothetical protein ABIH03_05700 [Pseudomonadota bacterium]